MDIRKMIVLGMFGGGVRVNTYDEDILALNPLIHFPLNESSGTVAVNQGSLGTDANGVYTTTIALAQIKAPGGGWAPLWYGSNSIKNVDIYSAAFAAAFNKQLFSIIVWWKVYESGTWSDAANRYVFTISSEYNNQIFTLKTATNGAVQNAMLNEGTWSTNNTTGHDETGWMSTIHTVNKSANEFKTYENGVLISTATVPKTWTAALAALECRIGNNRSVALPWSGYISRFSVLNSIIEPDNALEIHNKGIATLEEMPVNKFAADRAIAPLTIPTYDESGQAIHPSVYYNADGWNGHKFWMVMTPYPNNNGLVENPSIVVSEDGITWEVPDGLTNPIYAYTANGSNSDPELVMSGGTLYVFFRDSSDSTHFYFKRISSTDGVTWSEAADLFNTVSPNEEMSPAIVYANSKYYMFTVLYNNSTLVTSLRRRECATIDGVWSEPIDVAYTSENPHLILPWHIGATRLSGEERLLLAISTKTQEYIYMAESLDYGLNFVVDPYPILSRGADGEWDDFSLYRPCMAQVGSDLVLWYSGAEVEAGPTYTWGTARTIITET